MESGLPLHRFYLAQRKSYALNCFRLDLQRCTSRATGASTTLTTHGYSSRRTTITLAAASLLLSTRLLMRIEKEALHPEAIKAQALGLLRGGSLASVLTLLCSRASRQAEQHA